MSTRLLMLATLALGLSSAACQPRAEQGAALSAEDEAAIHAAANAWSDAARAGDWARLATLYTEDGTVLPPNAGPVQGRAAIQQLFAGFGSLQEITLTVVEVDGRGGLAYERGTYSVTFTPPGMTQPMRDVGKYIVVRRKQPDGSWPIAIDIWNSDLAPSAGG